MVSHSGTPSRAGQLRPLNHPRQIEVVVERGRPVTLVDRSHRHRIEQIQDTWIIDDEWWRDPISRQYFQVVLAGGIVRTIFHDRTSDIWFAQSY
ncbi:MAG: hypothetical protein M3173_03765 [Chloroflexota bacterium]|nr:hypothetical protein [Chloroflexota bacterium]